MSSILFHPLKAGAFELRNRIVMAPLTRCRASEGRVPNDLMAMYYAQRSSAGLILSEATAISPRGVGYPNTPGIWSAAQVEGWKKVTAAVQAHGSIILCQLWHVGRISDPIYLDGALPLAPSAIAATGHVSLIRPEKSFVTPQAMTLSEIQETLADYRLAAINANAAGFDGVELHAANGYLIDQFLQDSTNHRSDDYGGSLEKRMRFLLEIVDILIDVWGADRVAVHLAPRGDAHDMGDSDPHTLFTTIARELGDRKIAFICARESHEKSAIGPDMKAAFGGVFIANEGFTVQSAQAAIDSGTADAVAFGKAFIANPDLPARFENGAALNEPDPSSFYPIDLDDHREGYLDYPALKDLS
jgi:2,4-dienoyl-CoA reductase-like NADH-dependent reductase (Old Yellow Enzyme family)